MITTMRKQLAVVLLFNFFLGVPGMSGDITEELRNGVVNYCEWMKVMTPQPLPGPIYSNGLIATVDLPDRVAHQEVLVPRNGPVPDVTDCRLNLVEIDTASVYDFVTGRAYVGNYERLDRVTITYRGDRVIYQFSFYPELTASVEEYIPWEYPVLVHRIRVERSEGFEGESRKVRLAVRCFGKELQRVSFNLAEQYLVFSSPDCPFYLVVKANIPVESYGTNPRNFGIPGREPYTGERGVLWPWRTIGVLGFLLEPGPSQPSELVVVFATGLSEEEALRNASEVLQDDDELSSETEAFWNKFFGSCPLVVTNEPITFTHAPSGERRSISPEELTKAQLWNWRGVLTDIVRAPYLKCQPLTIADWGNFIGMWSNDGTEEALALSYTNQWALARECIVNWFKYAVNYKKGDGHCVWTLYPSGLTSFDHAGALDEDTEGVPLQARLVGHYLRVTGDTSILSRDLGNGRTLWAQLLAYENSLLEVRDINSDHLVDWLHIFETGWDNKHSPFIKGNRAPTTAINEQVFRLWSLSELVYMCKLRGIDPGPWEEEMEKVREAVESTLWSDVDKFYHDYDVEADQLWIRARNLDAFYWLFYENDPQRIHWMIARLQDPKEFNASLLPTLSLSNPEFRRDGYWDGRAWPRVHSYVGVALARAGYAGLGLEWVARALMAHLGPILPETLDPLADPVNESLMGPCRLMGYNALNCVALIDIVGLRMWDGRDLTIVPLESLPRLCVINAKWKGQAYDAAINRDKGVTLFHHRGEEICVFGPGAVFEMTEISDTRLFMQVRAAKETWMVLPKTGYVCLDSEDLGTVFANGRIHIPPGHHILQVEFDASP